MKDIELLNPLDMIAASTDRQSVTAGHHLDDVSVCPNCGNPMRRLTVSRRASPIEAWVCVTDRIALPMKNA